MRYHSPEISDFLKYMIREINILMCRYFLQIFGCIAVFLIIFSTCPHAFEYHYGAEVFEGLFVENNYVDVTEGTPEYDDTYNILGIYPYLSAELGKNISVHTYGELEWFYSWDSDNYDDNNDIDGEVTGAYLDYSPSGYSFDIGLQPFLFGNGKVFYNDEPGLAVKLNCSPRFYINGEAYRVFDRSSMATITLGYIPGFLETVEIIGAWFNDRDDGLADLYAPLFSAEDIESSGNLFWIGGQADFFIRDMFVSCLLLHQDGSIEIDNGLTTLKQDVNAWLIDLDINYNLTQQVSMGAFLFAASGDHHPGEQDLNTFVSPMPFNDRTIIFFNGGFERYDIEEAILPAGVTWDGVIAPGLSIEYLPFSAMDVKLAAALLYPEGGLFDQDTWYGWEIDTRLAYALFEDCELFFEAGIFAHGNYFKQTYGYQPDPVTRAVAGIDVTF